MPPPSPGLTIPPLLPLLPAPPLELPDPPLEPLEPPLPLLPPPELLLEVPPSPGPPPLPLPELPQAARASVTRAARMVPRFFMAESLACSPLVRDVDLLCLDAGNTIVFLDHARLARLCVAHGAPVETAALVRAEGGAKRAMEDGTSVVPGAWSNAQAPGARGWATYLATMVVRAGIDATRVPALLEAAWEAHVTHNLWSLVPEGLADALGRVRRAGVKVAVVSNSEGRLEALLVTLGLRHAFDLVVDSAIAGVEKPDPRIFRLALDRCGATPGRALHLGDIVATDVVGARAAGLRVALVDPHGHLDGRHDDVPRVPGAVAVADAIAASR